MRAFLLPMLLAPWLCGAAVAGPWPRAPGEGFVLLATGVDGAAARRRIFAEAYGEYGYSARLVLGTSLRREAGGQRADLFARWHPLPDAPVALGLTLGARLEEAGGRRLAPLMAAHLGRGMETRYGNLWARVDLQAVASLDGPRGGAELDLSGQVGLRREGGALAMLTLARHADRHGTTLKLTPAVGHPVGARSVLVLDATLLPRSRRLYGLRLSIWRGF